ncbi:MAG: hypothetical protein IPL57_13940 [Rubrivivax sp.]|nr:hypothetical protein [Rubrivivax sp.]
MDQDSGSGEPRLPISKAILAVLDRHAVPERQRLATLQAAVEMSYQQVRRRMTGESPWNVDEIKRLASHFGEPLFGLLATLVDDVGHQATLHLGGVALLFNPAQPSSATQDTHRPLVAVAGESADHWNIAPFAEAGERQAHEIKRLISGRRPPGAWPSLTTTTTWQLASSSSCAKGSTPSHTGRARAPPGCPGDLAFRRLHPRLDAGRGELSGTCSRGADQKSRCAHHQPDRPDPRREGPTNELESTLAAYRANSTRKPTPRPTTPGSPARRRPLARSSRRRAYARRSSF